MSLVEEGHNLVALLESGHAGANFFYGTCAIGSRNNAVLDAKGIFALQQRVS